MLITVQNVLQEVEMHVNEVELCGVKVELEEA